MALDTEFEREMSAAIEQITSDNLSGQGTANGRLGHGIEIGEPHRAPIGLSAKARDTDKMDLEEHAFNMPCRLARQSPSPGLDTRA